MGHVDYSEGVRPWIDSVDRQFVLHLIVASLGYFVAGKLGQATSSIRSSNLGPVWPAYGVAVAAFIAYGYRIWPAIAASAFIVAVEGSVGYPAAAGQAAGATIAAATATYLLRRIRGFDPALSRLRDAIGLMVFGAFGSALISASIGVTSMYMTGIQPYRGVESAWLIYWLGDSTGVLLVTPLVFTARRLLDIRSRTKWLELIALVLLLSVACFMVFGGSLISVRLDVLAFVELPFVIWGAINFGIGGATLSIFLIATLATILTAMGLGPFAVHTPLVNGVLLDVLFAVFAVSGLTLAAVIAERERVEGEHERLIREQASVDARRHLAAIVDSSNDPILSKTLDGVILSWNPAAERTFEYAEAEIVGRSINVLVPADRQNKQYELLRRIRAGERIEQFETVRVSKSGRDHVVVLTISPIRDAAGRIIGAAEIAHDITEEKRAEKALAAMKGKLLEAQEQERARIARELHDDISQRLALLSIDLAGLSEDLELQAKGISLDVEALSRELHPSRIETLGVTAGMRIFCKEFARHHDVEVDFEARDVPPDIPSDISLSLFRVFQEALRNAVKHSGAKYMKVRLWAAERWVNLTIQDRGAGFDLKAAVTCGGIGLATMYERMKLVGGRLRIRSVPQRGTTVHARVPLGQPPPASSDQAQGSPGNS